MIDYMLAIDHLFKTGRLTKFDNSPTISSAKSYQELLFNEAGEPIWRGPSPIPTEQELLDAWDAVRPTYRRPKTDSRLQQDVANLTQAQVNTILTDAGVRRKLIYLLYKQFPNTTVVGIDLTGDEPLFS